MRDLSFTHVQRKRVRQALNTRNGARCAARRHAPTSSASAAYLVLWCSARAWQTAMSRHIARATGASASSSGNTRSRAGGAAAPCAGSIRRSGWGARAERG
jgi:hypothetical protein